MKVFYNYSKHTVNTLITCVLLGASVSSCQIVNKYQSPETDTADLYRTDVNNGDTTTVATVPWTVYFTDTCLQQLIAEGLRENFDMQTALLRIEEAKASLLVARGSYFPVAGLVGQVTHSWKNGKDGAASSGNDQFRLGVAVQWEVDLWGKLNRQERARYAQYLNSHEYKRLIQTTLVSTIAASYYTLMALDEQLHISNSTVALLDESHKSMDAMMKAGILNLAAVEQSKALKLSTEASVLELEIEIHKLENALSVVLGRKPGPVRRQSFKTWQAPETLPYGVPAQMLSLRPDVRSAELQFRAAFELRNAAQASLYPSLTLNSGTMFGYDASSLSDFFKPENLFANIIGGLTQPIFAGNQLRAQLNIAKAQEQEALVNFQKTVLTAAGEVSDILFTYSNLQKKNEVRDKQLQSLSNAVNATQELLRAGEATYLEVLTAQQNYLSAQLAAVNDNLAKAQTAIDLYRALGGGCQ
ncbi:MAG: efflux transporter outer membrane subunit [Tannerella sp.]|nr:efflux transporter outer membrane subunit [Tannerella sp.]